ncbi:response regulator transcription factor [Cryobacterium sp. W22_MBD10_FK3]|uniref:response regulator transcription factor n=1 Tax=Cryobacterium sp. W22_MBD10_FK3 TaxID=3240273 RepID=UPI003F918FA7
MTRILIVEDDALQSELVRRYLEREGHDVTVLADGAEALAEVRRSAPDLLVLDVMLPGADGLTVCRTLREEHFELPILLLTARSTENDLLLGLELGADDYLAKPYSPRELVARVRALMRRARRTAPASTVIAVGDLEIDPDRHRATLSDRLLDLTRAEFDLLEEFALYPGIVLSRARLLDRLHGTDRWIGGRTIDTHVKNLRAKIEADPQNPARLITVYGVGYTLHAG